MRSFVWTVAGTSAPLLHLDDDITGRIDESSEPVLVACVLRRVGPPVGRVDDEEEEQTEEDSRRPEEREEPLEPLVEGGHPPPHDRRPLWTIVTWKMRVRPLTGLLKFRV